jgi:hypothetical protein
MPYYKYEPQSVFGNSYCKPYYDSTITSDRTVHKNISIGVMLDKTIKEAFSCLFNVLISNGHNPYSSVSQPPGPGINYTGPREVNIL